MCCAMSGTFVQEIGRRLPKQNVRVLLLPVIIVSIIGKVHWKCKLGRRQCEFTYFAYRNWPSDHENDIPCIYWENRFQIFKQEKFTGHPLQTQNRYFQKFVEYRHDDLRFSERTSNNWRSILLKILLQRKTFLFCQFLPFLVDNLSLGKFFRIKPCLDLLDFPITYSKIASR